MAKQDLSSNLKNIIVRLQGRLFTPDFMESLGQTIVNTVYKRVKTGKGIGKAESGFDKLSKSYVAYRKGQVRFFKKGGVLIAWKPKKKTTFPSPVTGEFGSPGKSNLTLTGQMLKALTFKFKDNVVDVYIEDSSRQPVAGRKPDGKTNKQVAEYVSERRPFLGLLDKEKRILTNMIRNHLIRTINAMVKGGTR